MRLSNKNAWFSAYETVFFFIRPGFEVRFFFFRGVLRISRGRPAIEGGLDSSKYGNPECKSLYWRKLAKWWLLRPAGHSNHCSMLAKSFASIGAHLLLAQQSCIVTSSVTGITRALFCIASINMANSLYRALKYWFAAFSSWEVLGLLKAGKGPWRVLYLCNEHCKCVHECLGNFCTRRRGYLECSVPKMNLCCFV